jgi:hypothetical protein
MDEAEVNQIAQELLALLAAQNIPVQHLSVAIFSPPDYIKKIVPNFPVRRRSIGDIAVTVSGQGWGITIGLALAPKKPEPSEGQAETVEPRASDSTQTDERRALDIVAKIQAIFDQHSIEVQFFRVFVIVPIKYYELIKHNFTKQSDSDLHAFVEWKGCTFGFSRHKKDRKP